MKKLYFVIGAITIIALVKCGSQTAHDSTCTDAAEHEETHGKAKTHNAHWQYEGETGPEYWASVCGFKDCNGNNQSPIDISEATSGDSLTGLDLMYHESVNCNFVNNGHSVQVNFVDSTNVFTLKGTDFILKQFHFHSPSEHTIAGSAYPCEVHLVHMSASGELAVIGILVKKGEENPFIAQLLKELPKKANDEEIIDTKVNPSEILPENINYYAYSGSLTTPPCTEGVNWFVLKHPVTASEAQINALIAVMPLNNARPVQNLNNRKVTESR